MNCEVVSISGTRGSRCASLVILALSWLVTGCASTHELQARAEPDALAAKLDAILIAPGGATVGVRIIELPSRREIYAHDADRPMMPASNMKLVTTATALDLFGADHAFETKLGVSGRDIYLIGGGDPGLGDPAIALRTKHKPTDDFAPLAEALRAKLDANGATRVEGDLYYDDHALDAQWILPTWSKSFREYWYGAPVSGLNFNDNCIDVTIHPTKAGGPVWYEVMPPTAEIKIVNQCTTAAKDAPQIKRGTGPNDYILSGTCAKTATLASKPVENPGRFTADAFRTYLAANGIAVDGQIKRADEPKAGDASIEIIATRGTPMSELLSRVNKPSQNFVAEALDKLSGESLRRAGTVDAKLTSWQAGEIAGRQFLERHHIDATALRMADGSGLSRDNRVTPRMLTDLLAEMSVHPHAELFRASLPIAGVDGTLRRRMPETKGRVQAKTGSINGVRALSGYAQLMDGRTVAFSILGNEIQGDEDVYIKRVDDAVRALVGVSAAPSPTAATTTPAGSLQRP